MEEAADIARAEYFASTGVPGTGVGESLLIPSVGGRGLPANVAGAEMFSGAGVGDFNSAEAAVGGLVFVSLAGWVDDDFISVSPGVGGLLSGTTSCVLLTLCLDSRAELGRTGLVACWD